MLLLIIYGVLALLFMFSYKFQSHGLVLYLEDILNCDLDENLNDNLKDTNEFKEFY